MDLAFHTKALRRICESESAAQRALGTAVSEQLKHRLADLQSASSLADVRAGNPQVISRSPKWRISIRLGNDQFFILEPNQIIVPLTPHGELDFLKVVRVKIFQIGKLND